MIYKKILVFSLFIILFLASCQNNDIVIKNNIILRGKEKKLYLIVDRNVICSNIFDIWVIDNYVYGWFYSADNKYIMFIFDISMQNIQTGDAAKNKINKLQLPLNNWMDYSEVFESHIINKSKYDQFFHNIHIIKQNQKY